MITIFHMIELYAVIGGAVLGFFAGRWCFGVVGGVVGAVLGLIVGHRLGVIPWRLAIRKTLVDLSPKSTDELHAMLRDEDCFIPNFVLLELARRGEDIQQELPVVLEMLESDHPSRRGFGWAALTSAFPELAKKISNYRPNQSPEICRKKMEPLRKAS